MKATKWIKLSLTATKEAEEVFLAVVIAVMRGCYEGEK